MSVNRNTILLFGSAAVLLIVAVIMAVSLTLRKGGDNERSINTYTPYDNSIPHQASPSSETIGPVTVYESVAGWRLAENTSSGFSLKVPDNWNINANVSGYDFKASIEKDGTEVIIDVYTYDNLDGLSASQWVKQRRKIFEFTTISIGSVSGVRYSGKVSYSDKDIIQNSYVLSEVFTQRDNILDVSCSTAGASYELFKQTCEDILSTFSFTK